MREKQRDCGDRWKSDKDVQSSCGNGNTQLKKTAESLIVQPVS